MAHKASDGVRVVVEEVPCRDPELVWQLDHRVNSDVGAVLDHSRRVATEERRDGQLALVEQLRPRVRPAGHRHIVDAINGGQVPPVDLEQSQTEVGIRSAGHPANQDVLAGQSSSVRDVGLNGKRVERTTPVASDHHEVQTLITGLHQQPRLHRRYLNASGSQCRTNIVGLDSRDFQALFGEPTLTGRPLDNDVRTQVRQPVSHYERARLRRPVVRSRSRGSSRCCCRSCRSSCRRSSSRIVASTARRKHCNGEDSGDEACQLA